MLKASRYEMKRWRKCVPKPLISVTCAGSQFNAHAPTFCSYICCLVLFISLEHTSGKMQLLIESYLLYIKIFQLGIMLSSFIFQKVNRMMTIVAHAQKMAIKSCYLTFKTWKKNHTSLSHLKQNEEAVWKDHPSSTLRFLLLFQFLSRLCSIVILTLWTE